MNIIFKHISIHGFLSLGDADIDLENQGYTLVKGINHDAEDGATSNGSGKSSIFSAICYAITGETIQGLKSNIVNIHGDGGCYVILDFVADGNVYKIARYRTYGKIGTDLKISVNGEDKSGKGIKESQAILGQYLPDIDSELIGSVILLGQGLPHKFTDNTPSGRKEVLERLSKSDYMIADIKDRLQKRTDVLSAEKRTLEDESLKLSERKSIYENQRSSSKEELAHLQSSTDNRQRIDSMKKEIADMHDKADDLAGKISGYAEEYNRKSNILMEYGKKCSSELKESYDRFGKQIEESADNAMQIDCNLRKLVSEVRTLDSITDICPTCHQKIPGVMKPDTTEKHHQIDDLTEQYRKASSEVGALKKNRDRDQADISDRYSREEQSLRTELDTNSSLSSSAKSELASLQRSIAEEESELSKLQIEDAGRVSEIATLTKKMSDIDASLSSMDSEIREKEGNLQKTDKSLDTVSGMMTLAKRDFRGHLLSNVIDYINRKAKEYSTFVFGTDRLSFALDGNNLDISYCGKSYENLSGGEKQKVDLVIQFSIRDMLCQYLGFSSNLICLDEIFDNLDSEGCTKVLNLISAKLMDIESVYIISHHADELAIPYDNTLIVEKDANGISSIIKE